MAAMSVACWRGFSAIGSRRCCAGRRPWAGRSRSSDRARIVWCFATVSPRSRKPAAPICGSTFRGPVSFDEAKAASRAYPGLSAHLFPSCFGCGPDREPGDGLRLFPGQLAGSQIVAAPLVPDASFADETGLLGSELAWAAVDCPQLWALILAAPSDAQDRVVTSQLAATVTGSLRAGQRYVVMAWPAGRRSKEALRRSRGALRARRPDCGLPPDRRDRRPRMGGAAGPGQLDLRPAGTSVERRQLTTCTTTVRSRGRSSKSISTSCCQVPSARRPPATGTTSEGPTIEARWWAWELVSWLSRLCS